MSVLGDFNTGVFGALSGSSSLITALGGTAIYYQIAPDKQSYPYVIFNWQSFMDENQTPSKMFNNILNVRVFASNPSEADTIIGTIDNLFDGHTLSVSGQTNFFSVRTMTFGDVFTDPSGIKTHVAGGLYRIRTGQ